VRSKRHWNMAELKPVDPVTLSLCSQIELDALVKKAADAKAKMEAKMGIKPQEPDQGLKPASNYRPNHDDEGPRADLTVDDVFGSKLKS
jgi:uncharacterized protein